MAWREDSSVRFINPYNFVSLGDRVNRADIDDEERELTGVISCALTTKTPLVIADHENVTESKEVAGHKIYDFFRVNGVPVIPGSGIRGMIRSAYEAVTDSCMSVCNVSILSARHPFPRKPGVVIYDGGKWSIYKAKKYMIKMPDRRGRGAGSDTGNTVYEIEYKNNRAYIKGTGYTTGSVVRFEMGSDYRKGNFTIGPTVRSIDTGSEEGVLLLWAYINNKHHNSVFVKQNERVVCANPDKAVNDFSVLMDMYVENDEKSYGPYKYTLNKDGRMYPVWYETVGDEVYLSPACISRTIFGNRLEDLIGSHKKCSRIDALCSACRLFGMVGDISSAGSRLRFSDALPEREIAETDFSRKTLAELASPKTTSTEFYTRRPAGALTWNYDYKTTGYSQGGRPEPARQAEKAKIRGRKFYFHSHPAAENADKTLRNSTVTQLNEGVSFTFDLYYDGISRIQLRQLVWLLCMGENNIGSTLMYKAGHGKPIGLGSVKITVDKVIAREIESANGTPSYKTTEYNPDDFISPVPFDTGKTCFREFMIMADAKTTEDKKVSYPIGDNGRNDNNSRASHQWFIGNRQLGDGARGMKHNIKYTLPFLTENLELPALVQENTGQRPGGGYNRYNNRSRQAATEPKPAEETKPAADISEYNPLTLTCATCAKPFIYTAREQAGHEKLRQTNPKIGPPKNCPDCKKSKKAKK